MSSIIPYSRCNMGKCNASNGLAIPTNNRTQFKSSKNHTQKTAYSRTTRFRKSSSRYTTICHERRVFCVNAYALHMYSVYTVTVLTGSTISVALVVSSNKQHRDWKLRITTPRKDDVPLNNMICTNMLSVYTCQFMWITISLLWCTTWFVCTFVWYRDPWKVCSILILVARNVPVIARKNVTSVLILVRQGESRALPVFFVYVKTTKQKSQAPVTQKGYTLYRPVKGSS